MTTEPSTLAVSNHARLDFEQRCASQVTPISLIHFDGRCVVQLVVLGRRKDDVELYPCGDVVALGQRFRFSHAYVAMLLEQGIPYVEAIETAAFVARALAEVQTIAEIGDRSIVASIDSDGTAEPWWIARLHYTCTGRAIQRPEDEQLFHMRAEAAHESLTRRVKRHLAVYPDANVNWLSTRTTEERHTCSALST